MRYDFVWDPAKARKNLAKHGVPFEIAVAIFEDPLLFTKPDARHGDRWITMGIANGQLLVVIHTDVETTTIKAMPRASGSSRRAAQPQGSDGLIVTSAERAFARAKGSRWPKNFPKSDEDINLSDIPEQDFSGPDIVRGKYRELALAAQGFVQLDSDIRPAFPDTKSVNKALRNLLCQKRHRKKAS